MLFNVGLNLCLIVEKMSDSCFNRNYYDSTKEKDYRKINKDN